MSVLGKIFSAGAGELVKNVGGVLDNLTTTKEEKLAAEAKIKDLIMGYEAVLSNKHSVISFYRRWLYKF